MEITPVHLQNEMTNTRVDRGGSDVAFHAIRMGRQLQRFVHAGSDAFGQIIAVSAKDEARR